MLSVEKSSQIELKIWIHFLLLSCTVLTKTAILRMPSHYGMLGSDFVFVGCWDLLCIMDT